MRLLSGLAGCGLREGQQTLLGPAEEFSRSAIDSGDRLVAGNAIEIAILEFLKPASIGVAHGLVSRQKLSDQLAASPSAMLRLNLSATARASPSRC